MLLSNAFHCSLFVYSVLTHTWYACLFILLCLFGSPGLQFCLTPVWRNVCKRKRTLNFFCFFLKIAKDMRDPMCWCVRMHVVVGVCVTTGFREMERCFNVYVSWTYSDLIVAPYWLTVTKTYARSVMLLLLWPPSPDSWANVVQSDSVPFKHRLNLCFKSSFLYIVRWK